jgi:NAD(P)-dependent dehydrogenase (short-subunit alcohol dehydrogenase family)
MTQERHTTRNPREAEPKPPFPQQQQMPPGIEAEMRPRPDYGEKTYRGHGRLKGKAAIITGGDSGIGRAVALAFAREGADVLISYLNEEQDAQETVRVVKESGVNGVAVPGDIGNEEHCRHLVARAVRELGHLELLVNNAAYQSTHKSITEIPADELEYTFRTNIFAMFYLCKAALPHMRSGASIVNTASIQAYQPSPTLLHYASTKGAIVTFTKGFSKETIKKGIRVNAVAPGPVWTPLIVSTMPESNTEKFGADDPEGRPAQPAELAPAYVFLASDESRYINGEVIGVTGGEFLG